MRKHKQYDDDDGKVIANMNVDGMPWYIAKLHEGREDKAEADPVQLDRKERLAYLRGAMTASFLITAIFGVVFAAVIILLLLVWN